MNDRHISECDWCHEDVVTSLFDDKYGDSGVDILRPFNPSFEHFLGVESKETGDIQICKSCAEKMANYVENVMKV